MDLHVLLHLFVFTSKIVLRQFRLRDPYMKTLYKRDLSQLKKLRYNHFGKFDFRIAQLFTIP